MEEAGEKQLKAVVHRCPFCHESAEAEGSVACQGCLARHHEACWREGGRCGSCGAERALAPTALPPLTVDQAGQVLRERGYAAREVAGFMATLQGAARPPASPERLRGGGWALVFALLVLVSGALAGLSMANESKKRQQRFDIEHAKLERLLSEEHEVGRRLDSARRQLLELTAELQGDVPDGARRRTLTAALQVAEAEVKELTQRHAQAEFDRENQERYLSPN